MDGTLVIGVDAPAVPVKEVVQSLLHIGHEGSAVIIREQVAEFAHFPRHGQVPPTGFSHGHRLDVCSRRFRENQFCRSLPVTVEAAAPAPKKAEEPDELLPCKPAAPAASAPAASAPAASAPAAEPTGMKVCIVTSSGIDDGSFNQNCYEGILDFIADHPDCTVQDIKEPDYNELINAVDRLVADYDAFVLPGFNFTAIGDVAMNNPDKYFLVVDSTITDSQGNAVTLDNVYTMTFSEQEGGFFAGMAAAFSVNDREYPAAFYRAGLLHYGDRVRCHLAPLLPSGVYRADRQVHR